MSYSHEYIWYGVTVVVKKKRKKEWNREISYMWIANPWRRKELPAPHTVYRPSIKSVGWSGIWGGFHRSWVGVAEALDWLLNSLTSFSWPASRRLNGSCVTDGFIRYSQLQPTYSYSKVTKLAAMQLFWK